MHVAAGAVCVWHATFNRSCTVKNFFLKIEHFSVQLDSQSLAIDNLFQGLHFYLLSSDVLYSIMNQK